MAIRIDVVPTIPDARAEVRKRAFEEVVGRGKVRKVHVADSYLIDTDLSKAGLAKARLSLTNPVIEKSYLGRWLPKRFNWGVEIGYLPGVTDNVGTTAKETIEDSGHRFKEGEQVYSSQVFLIEGTLSEKDVDRVAASLYNPLIQTARIFDTSARKHAAPLVVPRVSLSGSSRVLTVDLDMPDAELEQLSKYGIAGENGTPRGPLGLSVAYLHAIRAHFKRLGRNPTDIELETLAQTWSEHCKHTIFASPIDGAPKGIYRTYIKGATERIRALRRAQGKKDFCVSVFKDNSGGIDFDGEYVVTHKVETHNSPSALDPFGGAITGIVGVNRDSLGFGLGAKPVANVYGFCFAPPDDARHLYRLPAQAGDRQELLPAKRIAEGVIKGINAGGNQSGIPTMQGFMLFDSSYRGKPLVFAGTVGILPKKKGGRKLYEKKAMPGDYIVMVGGRVGLDGIHGATFSSVELNSGSPATAVQIGDPITQKKFSDAIAKEARDMNLYNSITDNGAGGLSSSVGEMAEQSGGCRVSLEKVPLKYPGLEPWQIWISESQERMTLAVPEGKWKAFSSLMERRGVEATVIGEFTKSGSCVVEYEGKKVLDIGLDFLHNGVPLTHLHTVKPDLRVEAPKLKLPKDYSGALAAMLGRLNLASNEFLSRQFDHEVQGTSVIKPVQGAGRVSGDVGVFKPILSSSRAVVLSSALAPFYSDIDPYKMAAAAVDAAVRAAVAAGASIDYLALLDNFCWTESDKPERLWQLTEAAKACYDLAIAYGTPYISGKDSMFNDFKGYDEKGNFVKVSALPTLLISTIGVLEEAEKAISIDAKSAGDYVYLLGDTREELGGSEYFRMVAEHGQEGKIGGKVPHVDAKKNLKLYKAFGKAVQSELVASAISVNRGGLAIALSRMAMAGKLGVDVDISKASKLAPHAILFSESQGRILATVRPEAAEGFEKLFKGLSIKHIGAITRSTSLTIRSGKKKIASLSLDKALTAYRKTFKDW